MATGFPAIASPYPVNLVERDEFRRQHIIPRDHLRGSDPRIAAAVRLGPEHRHHGRGVVGLCGPAAGRLGHAVRPVRFGIRTDLDRSRQRGSVHGLCADLDGRARIRSSPAAADPAVRRRRAVAHRVSHIGRSRFLGRARARQLRHYHRLHLGDGVRVLAGAASLWSRAGRRSSCCSPTVRSICCARRSAPCCRGRRRATKCSRASGRPCSASRRCCSPSPSPSSCWRWPRSAPSTGTRRRRLSIR